MADEFSLAIIASYNKNGVSLSKSFDASIDISGNYPISDVQDIGTGDETLNIGADIATLGYLILKNQAALVSITTPAAPTVTNVGTPATTTVTYKIVAKQSDGSYSAASTGGTTTTASATLTNVNYNHLVWVDQTAATGGYDIYRTAAGGTPSTTGKIAHVAAGVTTYDDIGGAGDSGTAPATGVDNVVLLGEDGSSYPHQLKGQEFSANRWNGAAIHAKANTAAIALEKLLLPD